MLTTNWTTFVSTLFCCATIHPLLFTKAHTKASLIHFSLGDRFNHLNYLSLSKSSETHTHCTKGVLETRAVEVLVVCLCIDDSFLQTMYQRKRHRRMITILLGLISAGCCEGCLDECKTPTLALKQEVHSLCIYQRQTYPNTAATRVYNRMSSKTENIEFARESRATSNLSFRVQRWLKSFFLLVWVSSYLV